MIKIQEIKAKSILNKSKIFDYCINTYTGCQISCKYCYASLFMRRHSGHKEQWSEFVDAKINASGILRKQLQNAKRGTVWISSVCDPYQPLEAKYELTRSCLKELLNKQFPVNVQTKSKLVLRDLDLLQAFEDIEVGFTISTDDEKVARLFEPNASSVNERLNALRKIHETGIKTFAFVGPILPGNPENLIKQLEGKADRIYLDRMNYLNQVKAYYLKHGFEHESSDEFFREYKERMISELKKNKMKFELLF
ncbi:radical SAM protein [Thermodesulfobacteriota bacterium]